MASKALPGKPVGRVRFVDTRPDDPNDIVPHQDRRELRAYGVFAAWLNHVDAKAINSLDVLVSENGKSFVRHYLIDFGSALGSGGVGPADYWAGAEYLVQPRDVARQMVSFGFSVPKWRTTPFYEASAIGRLPQQNTDFNPELWKPRVPNQAFLHARSDDKFWAAQKLAALTTDMIRAAVRAGEFGDPAAEAFLVRALAERRDAIGRAYLTAVNPISEPALDAEGMLTFKNAAVEADVARRPSEYRATWSKFDNATHQAELHRRDVGADHATAGTCGTSTQRGCVCEGGIERSRECPCGVGETGERLLPAGSGWLEARGRRADRGVAEVRKPACYDSPDCNPLRGEFHVRGGTTARYRDSASHRVPGVRLRGGHRNCFRHRVRSERATGGRCRGQDFGRTAPARPNCSDRRQRAVPVSIPDARRIPRRD